MNPFKPITNLTDAIVFPFKAIFVVGLCFAINAMTNPGHWWAQWVALGMGIALLRVWGRALSTVLTTAVAGGLGYAVYRWWTGRKQDTHASRDTFTASRSR
ncbi:MAG: hypothetical protein ABI905_06765 [Betaproteobacteria bacterium]